MEHKLDEGMLGEFRTHMLYNEKSSATISKYMRDMTLFYRYMGEDGTVTKEKVIGFKQMLTEQYAPSCTNSMLAAVNGFLKFMGWYDCVVKSLKIQQEAFRPDEKELKKSEYYRLLEAAKEMKNKRLYYVMETIGSTGIRISELKFITVEAVQKRKAKVTLKGKTRTVLLPKELCRQLQHYIEEKDNQSGPIFITKNGQSVDRSNICREMKALSRISGVSREKIFPHNLRHMFACVYYEKAKDISHLADLLGHSNANTTRIYTKLSSGTQERQINLLKLVI